MFSFKSLHSDNPSYLSASCNYDKKRLLFTCTETTNFSFYWKHTLLSVIYEMNVYIETFSLPTDAHNVKKHRVIKTF